MAEGQGTATDYLKENRLLPDNNSIEVIFNRR